jgi:hypothetical protein
MKKKIIIMMLICSLIITYIPGTIIYGAGEPVDMQTAYDEIAMQRPDWGASVEAFDIDIWNDYKVLLVDNGGTYPSNIASLLEPDGSANDYNSDAGEYRHIGKNPDGYLVNNPKYPDDHSGSAVINTYEWQENTTPNTDISQYMPTPEDKEFYEKEIFYFLETEYEARFDDTVNTQTWLDNAIVIVPVSSTGKGVIKFMHEWDSDHNGVKEDWYITVNLRSKNEAIVEGWVTEITTPTINTGVATLATTRIAADSRGTESFDVTKGIPTSEDLYVNVQVSEYVHNETYNHVDGSITYKVTVTKRYRLWRWDLDDVKVDLNGDGDYDDSGETTAGWDSKIETVTKTYDVVRLYSFHMIDGLAVYSLDKADITNTALPGGSLTLHSTVVAPIINMTRDTVVANHYNVPISGTTHTVDAGTQNIGKSHSNTSYDPVPNQNLQSSAEAGVGEVQVKNDTLVLNGATLMDGAWYNAVAPTPSQIPDAPLNNLDDLYKTSLTINNSVTNGTKTSSGVINYDVVENTGTETSHNMPITGLNDVVVHTPVVCYPTITEDTDYIQAVDKDITVQNLVLDRTFEIYYPNNGQHINEVGYGMNDYEKYIDQKQVKFDFDAYLGNDRSGTFVAANTWFDLDKIKDDYTFFIPHWVNEGSNTILFRVIPINDINNSALYGYNANMNNTNYRSVENINVNLIGQIYDFKIISTTDPNFSDFFFTGGILDNSIYVGNKDKHGNIQATHDDVFPLMSGSNTISGYQNKVIKKGHSILFSIKSVGNMADNDDFVTLKPKFYYVDMSGNNRQEVDVWHKEGGSYVNMNVNKKVMKMSLSNLYTGISSTELTNTATGMYSLYGSSLTLAEYQEKYLWEDTRTANKVGDTGLIALDWQQRTFIGETNSLPTSVSSLDALTGRQQYYGMYMIPSAAIFVPKGTITEDVMTSKLINGYCIITFDVETIDSFAGDPTDIHLSYDDAEGNMYDIEGYNNSQNGYTFNDGDTVFYYTDQAADSDYNSVTTH